MLSPSSRAALLVLAKRAINDFLIGGQALFPDPASLPAELRSRAGVFVTLRKNSDLRGCTGSIEPTRTLAHEVMVTAVSSAVNDPRFAPVTLDEFSLLTIEISVLSAFQPIHSADEIVPHRHGVLVHQDLQKGLFLPQVWEETGWDKSTFLNELCQSKAGLPPDALKDPRTQLFVFEVEAFEATVPDIGQAAASF